MSFIGYYRTHEKFDSWNKKLDGLNYGIGSADNSYVIQDKSVKVNRSFNTTGNISEGDSFMYEFDTLSFIKPKLSFLSHFDVSVTYGSFFYIFIILLAFAQYMKIMATEKDHKLRKGLIPFGLSGVSYWTTWVIYAVVLISFWPV